MAFDALAELGFSPSEIAVYTFLLKQGPSYPNRISAAIGINRTNVYEALDRLVRKGVVTHVAKNKVKWFEAKLPESIAAIVSQREEEFRALKASIGKEIKELQAIRQDAKPLEATIFVGKKGLRSLFEEMLEKRKPVCILASQFQLKEVFGPYFELWHKQRIALGIAQRTIFPQKFKGTLEQRKYLQYKFVDDRFTNPTTTIIFGDVCVFIQWCREPLSIRIQNSEIARSHQNYFDMLWNSR